MAEDINATLRAQLMAALAVLAPQIRGLPDVAATSVSGDMIAALNQQLTVRKRRHDLIQRELDQLDQAVTALAALEADGWPAPVSIATIDVALFEELQGEQSDLEAAIALFREAANITGGDPSFSPNTDPPVTTGP